MARVRRPALAADIERRLRERKAKVGGDLRQIRERRRWTQEQLAERAGVGRLIVSRVERGIGPLELETMERLGRALDVPVLFGFGRDLREDVADAGHLSMQELVLRAAREAGFEVRFELATRQSEPWRSIDVGLALEQRRLAIEVECWNTIGDVGAATRSSTRKQVELEGAAIARWGTAARARLVWVVRATARNQELVARYPEVFAARFPGASRAWIETLTTGVEPPTEPGLVWCDVGATKLYAWRRS